MKRKSLKASCFMKSLATLITALTPSLVFAQIPGIKLSNHCNYRSSISECIIGAEGEWMLYPVLLRTIERGDYDAAVIQEKLDSLFAARRLTAEQYEELTRMIADSEQSEEESENR